MAEHATINIEELVKPISDDFPAGVRLQPDDRELLDKMRKNHDPEDYPEGDPLRYEEKQSANWSGIIEHSCKLLRTKTKDLNVATRLLEALAHKYGFKGVRDGFSLIHKLLAEAWTRIHPEPMITDHGGAEARLNDLKWLDGSGMKSGRFNITLSSIPIAEANGFVVSVLNCRPSGKTSPLVSADQIRLVASLVPESECAETVQAIRDSIAEIGKLQEAASTGLLADLLRLGEEENNAKKLAISYVPALTDTRKALDDCKVTAEHLLREKSAAGGSTSDLPLATPLGSNTGTSPVTNVTSNREQLYQQLKQIADNLERIDPHSPVPFLIRRTVELRALKFPNLVEVLKKDASVLDFMKNPIEEKKEGQ
ncbi:MAG TPA: type VI secretion system ImpA family N-terminal domain-containing protein [Gemmatales bacterium]|nr:type VI secretion system ImpA family N-terminal domain-containing protein [Gemmatales bacterium]